MSDIKYVIEPEEPIMSEEELISEIIAWSERENKHIDIMTTSKMEVSLMVDGKMFIAKLEPPKRVTGPKWFNTSAGVLGFKCVYFYQH